MGRMRRTPKRLAQRQRLLRPGTPLAMEHGGRCG